MKVKAAAAVFSWLGGIANVVLEWVLLVPLFSRGAYWVIPLVYTIFVLIILAWRDAASAEGHIVGCGVCTLLFVSIIGGILTLCIPADSGSSSRNTSNRASASRPSGGATRPSGQNNAAKSDTSPAKPEEPKIDPRLVEAKRKLAWDLCQGKIKQEEYDAKLLALEEFKEPEPEETPEVIEYVDPAQFTTKHDLAVALCQGKIHQEQYDRQLALIEEQERQAYN